MRKSVQDKVFDQVLKRLPALSNDDLASVAVACQQLAQWRAQGQRNALRIPDSRRTPRVAPTVGEAVDDMIATGDGYVELPPRASWATATPHPTGAGDEVMPRVEGEGNALQLDTQGQSVAEQAQSEPTSTQEIPV